MLPSCTREHSNTQQTHEQTNTTRTIAGLRLFAVCLLTAHTACSFTSSFVLLSSCTNTGMAPCSITTRVCFEVPEAMLVRAHADSN